MLIKKKITSYFFVSFSVLILNLRPGIIGELNGIVLFSLLLFLMALYITTHNHLKINIMNNTYILYILMIIFVMYALIQAILIAKNIRPAFNSSLTLLISIHIFLLLIQDFHFINIFNKTLVVIIILLSISSLVTYIMYYLKLEIKLTDIQTHQRGFVENYASLYFPFTIMGANEYYFSSLYFMERSFGIFREPGIYQVYIQYAYFLVDLKKVSFKRYHNIIKIMIILSLITTFSFSGIIIFIFLITIKACSERANSKILNILIISLFTLAVSGYLLTLFNTRIASESFFYRFDSLKNIVSTLSINPLFGLGYLQKINTVSTVNFLGSIVTIGIIGSTIYLLIWIISIALAKEKKYLLLPFFITLFFAQPIYSDPIIFLILLLNSKEPKLENN